MKFSIKDLFSKFDQLSNFLCLLKENFIFCAENAVSLKQRSISIKCNEEEQIPFTPPLGDS